LAKVQGSQVHDESLVPIINILYVQLPVIHWFALDRMAPRGPRRRGGVPEPSHAASRPTLIPDSADAGMLASSDDGDPGEPTITGQPRRRCPAGECHPHRPIPPKIRYSPQGIEWRQCLTRILRVLVSPRRNTAGRGNLHTPLDCGECGGWDAACAGRTSFAGKRGSFSDFLTPPCEAATMLRRTGGGRAAVRCRRHEG